MRKKIGEGLQQEREIEDFSSISTQKQATPTKRDSHTKENSHLNNPIRIN
jgi:hypothetical protein